MNASQASIAKDHGCAAGAFCGLVWGSLKAVRARARVQGEATVYENPFSLSRFASTPRSNELACRKPVSRKFTGALRRGRFVASAGAR